MWRVVFIDVRISGMKDGISSSAASAPILIAQMVVPEHRRASRQQLDHRGHSDYRFDNDIAVVSVKNDGLFFHPYSWRLIHNVAFTSKFKSWGMRSGVLG